MAGPPVIHPKAVVVKAAELSPYYSIYKLEPQCLFARVCNLHTLSALHIYIYTLEAQRSLARVFYIHSLSPSSPDLNKTVLWPLSLSPPSQLAKEVSGSCRTGKGRRCSVHSIAFGEGGNPLPAPLFSFTRCLCGRATDPFFLAAIRSVGRSGLPPHALPQPDDPKV